MCCCVKSHRHCCLQSFLVILLVICVVTYTSFFVFDIGLVLLTSSATVLKNTTDQSSPNANLIAPISVGDSLPALESSPEPDIALPPTNPTNTELESVPSVPTNTDLESVPSVPDKQDDTVLEVLATDGNQDSAETLPQPEMLVDEKDATNAVTTGEPDWCTELADQIVNDHFYGNCSLIQFTVESAKIMNLCGKDDEGLVDEITNLIPGSKRQERKFVECVRTSLLWSAFDFGVPLFFLLWSLIAVCRLHLCSIIFLAFIYLAMAISMVLGSILFESGKIIESGGKLFIVIIVFITIYTILALFHILLFILVKCERRYGHQDKNGQNGDSEKMVKSSMNGDDEFDGDDDPNVPLYRNGAMPEKKNDFEEKTKGFKFIDDDMSYIFRKG